jgi:hypothetical protein
MRYITLHLLTFLQPSRCTQPRGDVLFQVAYSYVKLQAPHARAVGLENNLSNAQKEEGLFR